MKLSKLYFSLYATPGDTFSLFIIQAEVYGVLGGVTLFTMGSLTARPRKAGIQTPLRKSTLMDAIAPILHSLMRSTLGRIHL